jgi:hypothetical protein
MLPKSYLWLTSVALATTGFVCAPGEAIAANFVFDWQASSGLTPDQMNPSWSLGDTASPEAPQLINNVLRLSTSANSESMYYIQASSTVDTSSAFFIETRLRFASGSTSYPTARAPIAIALTTAPNIGNALFIDQDQVYFLTGNLSSGPKVRVDTDDNFHTYRIQYDGAGGLSLLYDDQPILSGSTFSSSAANGSQQRILWGEGSIYTHGVSEWAYFRHNALKPSVIPAQPTSVPEPTSLLGLAAIGAAAAGSALKGCCKRNWPYSS